MPLAIRAPGAIATPAVHYVVARALPSVPPISKRQAGNDGLYTPDAAEGATSKPVEEPEVKAIDGVDPDVASAYLASGIPPAILSDPAVQAAISSVANEKGIPVSDMSSMASDSISSINAHASGATDTDTDTAAAATKTRSSDTETETSGTDTAGAAGGAKTPKPKVGPAGHNSTSIDDDDFGNDNSSSSGNFSTSTNGKSSARLGFQVSYKVGWLALATLGAGYFVMESA